MWMGTAIGTARNADLSLLPLPIDAPAHREGTPSIQRPAWPIEGIVMGFLGYLLIGSVVLVLVVVMQQVVVEDTKRARMTPEQRAAHDKLKASVKLRGHNS